MKTSYVVRHGHERSKKADGSAQRVRRREEANQRNKERRNRSSQEQLAKLDSLLGIGIGAVKERTRLLKQ